MAATNTERYNTLLRRLKNGDDLVIPWFIIDLTMK